MDIFERIKKMASNQGLSIKTIEINAGLGNGTIRRWGSSPPSADKLLKIANMLNTTCEYLITGEQTSSTISVEDSEWLSLIHRLPRDAQLEFKGEIKGYIRCLNKDSIATDKSLGKTGTTDSVK